jgi:hypothetical protein
MQPTLGGDFDVPRGKAAGALEVCGQSWPWHGINDAAIPRVAGDDRDLAIVTKPPGHKQRGERVSAATGCDQERPSSLAVLHRPYLAR